MTVQPPPGGSVGGANPPARPDPLIDEIRAIRGRMSEECGNDLDRLVARLRDVERRVAERLVQAPPTEPGRSSRVA
jgi:hypothetical protein